MEGCWVGRVGWPIADNLSTEWSPVNHQSMKVCRPDIDVLTTEPRHLLASSVHSEYDYKYVGKKIRIVLFQAAASVRTIAEAVGAPPCASLALRTRQSLRVRLLSHPVPTAYATRKQHNHRYCSHKYRQIRVDYFVTTVISYHDDQRRYWVTNFLTMFAINYLSWLDLKFDCFNVTFLYFVQPRDGDTFYQKTSIKMSYSPCCGSEKNATEKKHKN